MNGGIRPWPGPTLRAALDSDATSHTRTPPSFRSPCGALEDSFYMATGRQLWDASFITAPTLVLAQSEIFGRAQKIASIWQRTWSIQQQCGLSLFRCNPFCSPGSARKREKCDDGRNRAFYEGIECPATTRSCSSCHLSRLIPLDVYTSEGRFNLSRMTLYARALLARGDNSVCGRSD